MVSKTVFSLLLLAATLGVTSSGDVVKRSDDSDPYAAVINTHAQELANLQARLQAVENRLAKQTSFRVILTKQEVTANAPIHFEPESNTGGAHYDPHTGIYTVTTPGMYLFGFQLFPQFQDDILMDLYVKGAIRMRSRCYDSNAYPTSCAASTVLHLQDGDTVWVQSNKGGLYYPTVHSFFSGALISPDP